MIFLMTEIDLTQLIGSLFRMYRLYYIYTCKMLYNRIDSLYSFAMVQGFQSSTVKFVFVLIKFILKQRICACWHDSGTLSQINSTWLSRALLGPVVTPHNLSWCW